MGYGVFAGTPIFEGQLLDEYFGELIPPRTAATLVDDDYIFQIRNVASSSAKDFGNWTRFVNHSCRDFNVEAVNDVLGGRRTITFKALRNIAVGEELFIDYGTKYFGDKDGDILCRCSAFPNPHIPPDQLTETPKTQQALPGRQPQPEVKPSDVSIPEKNAWIARNKAWLDEIMPDGYPLWTMLHWRLLEQLMRRRRNYHDWQSKSEYNGLPSSKGDPLIQTWVTKGAKGIQIREWHLDVAKAFQRDNVCGTKGDVKWETSELLARMFAIILAARHRRRKSGRRRSWATTPPLIQGPVTPPPSGTAPGSILTPPATGRLDKGKGKAVEYPELPSDISTPVVTARQARRASVRRRRRQQQRQSYSP